MRGNSRFKKWGIAFVTVWGCMLTIVVSTPRLFAEETQPTDQINSTPTPTVQKTTQPTETEQVRPSPAQTVESRPTTTINKPVPAQTDKKDRSGGGIIAKDEMLVLGRCIEIALKQNQSIIAAVSTVEVNRSRVGESRSAYYPQLSASGNYSRIKPIPGTPAGPAQYNDYSGTATLNQTIYDFGKTSSSVGISKYNLEASRSDLTFTQDTIILNVKQAYYGVLQAKRNLEVAADVIKQFQLHLDQAKGFYEVGTKAKIDVIKAEVDLSNAKLSLINADNALKIAQVTLNNAMGVPDAPEYTVEDNLSFQQYAVTLEEATARAFENRPDLKSTIAKRQAAEENISLQRSGYLPVFSASATYTTSGAEVSPNQLNNSWNAGVTLTIPLFNGFLTTHQVAEAKSNLYVFRANEEAIRQRILLDVRQAYLNLQATEASISTAELASKQAQENLDLANGRYAAGVGSPIEVSDAFATYVTARATYTNTLYSYKIAQANIEKATGSR